MSRTFGLVVRFGCVGRSSASPHRPAHSWRSWRHGASLLQAAPHLCRNDRPAGVRGDRRLLDSPGGLLRFTTGVFVALGFACVIVAGIFLMALFTRTFIRAGSAGLEIADGIGRSVIPWASIQELTVDTSRGLLRVGLVEGNDSTFEVPFDRSGCSGGSWFADAGLRRVHVFGTRSAVVPHPYASWPQVCSDPGWPPSRTPLRDRSLHILSDHEDQHAYKRPQQRQRNRRPEEVVHHTAPPIVPPSTPRPSVSAPPVSRARLPPSEPRRAAAGSFNAGRTSQDRIGYGIRRVLQHLTEESRSPAPPLQLSRSPPPSRRSIPPLPNRASFPALPQRLSFPWPPEITSRSSPPKRRSPPCPPQILSIPSAP